MKNLYFLFIALLPGFSSCQNIAPKNEKPYLIILSMDGFRWDYPDSVLTPNLLSIGEMGVRAESMQVSFPSKTFPNHYTLVTGLVPDHHGIVNNSFYATEFDEFYSIGNRKSVQDGKFYGGEPIWNTAEKQGVKAASYFWVGSEADIQGMHPSYWKVYDHHMNFYSRVDSVMAWLSLPDEKRPHLILWYVPEPDEAGHDFGPHTPKTDSMIQSLDHLLGYFMEKLSTHPLSSKVNVIVTSDHGMGGISPDNTIVLENYLDTSWIKYLEGGDPIYNIQSTDGFSDSVYLALSQIKDMKIFRNTKMPSHLNYGTNPRCLEFTIVADSGFSILSEHKPNQTYSLGTHGYDITNKDMNAIFFAWGPAFQSNYNQVEFKNVDVYPLMCKVLNLVPAVNDGQMERVQGMLK